MTKAVLECWTGPLWYASGGVPFGAGVVPWTPFVVGTTPRKRPNGLWRKVWRTFAVPSPRTSGRPAATVPGAIAIENARTTADATAHFDLRFDIPLPLAQDVDDRLRRGMGETAAGRPSRTTIQRWSQPHIAGTGDSRDGFPRGRR